MRFQLLSASVLAAASILTSGVAAQDDGYVTSVSTFTIWRTVERVVETAYATPTASSSAPPVDTELPHEPTLSTMIPSPVASASMAPLPHYNGTKPAPSGSGFLSSSTVSMSSGLPQATGNSAPSLGSDWSFPAAIAGIIGLAAL